MKILLCLLLTCTAACAAPAETKSACTKAAAPAAQHESLTDYDGIPPELGTAPDEWIFDGVPRH